MTKKSTKQLFIGLFALAIMMLFMKADVTAAEKLNYGNMTFYVTDRCLYMKQGNTSKYMTSNVEQILDVYSGKVYYEYTYEYGDDTYSKLMSININDLQINSLKNFGKMSPYFNKTNGRYIVYTLIGGDGEGSCFSLYSYDCVKNKIYKLGKNVMTSGFMIANKKVYYASLTGGKLKIYRCTLTGKSKSLRKQYKVAYDKNGIMICDNMKKYSVKLTYSDKKGNDHTKTFKFKK